MNAITYVASRIKVFDGVGNTAELYKSTSVDTTYTTMGSMTSVSIPSFVFVNSASDNSPPTIMNVSFNNGAYVVPTRL